MNRQRPQIAHVKRRESGAVLIVSLLMLLILTLIGVTVARMQTVEERLSQNEQNRASAVQIAEAALREVEFNGLALGGWSVAQTSANSAGFYTLNPNVGSVVPTINWNNPAQVANVCPACTIPGPGLASITVSQPPAAVIEAIPPVGWPGSGIGNAGNSTTQAVPTFRITVHAWGPDGTSAVTIQSIMHP